MLATPHRSLPAGRLVPLGLAVLSTAAALTCLLGCRSSVAPLGREFIEDDHVTNYRRVFQSSPPEEVDVLNSIVVAYNARSTAAREDWAFELVVPPAWIERTASRLHLRRAEANNVALGAINERKDRPLRSWYAPKPVSQYELYYLSLTSVPHVHMLVEADPGLDGRRRVFISKQ